MGEDMAVWCFAQASEGDFTVGKEKVDRVASNLAYNWVHSGINPNNTDVCREECWHQGFDFNILTYEEVEYLCRKIEEEIKRYATS